MTKWFALAFLLLLSVVLLAGDVVAQETATPQEPGVLTFAPGQLETAIAVGTRAKGGRRGLVLRDTGQAWAQALTAFGNGLNGTHNAMPSTGFWVEAWTPLSWIEQQASNAAKRYLAFTTDDVDGEMRAPLFRVVVHPDTPAEVTARGMLGTSSVEHVVLRCDQKKLVVQPLGLEPFTEDAQNAMGAKVEFQGVIASFPLDGLAAVRGKSGEFFITVIGNGGEEKIFKVKSKHFANLR